MLLGKPVPQSELQEVLDEEKKKDTFQEQLKEELRGIKKGECLRYEVKEGGAGIQSVLFSILIGEIKGLKLVTKGNFAYVYRE